MRLGVSVGRRVGGAVDRNRVKRVLREAFWALDEQLPEDHDFVIVARAGAAEVGGQAGLDGVRAELAELLERLAAAHAGTRASEMAAVAGNARADGSDQALSARDLTRAAAPLQVRADVLGLRRAGDPRVRPGARLSCWRSGGCCAATRSATGGTTPLAPSACSDDLRPRKHLLSLLIDALDWLITTLHDDVGSRWGWAIVALTVIVRLLMIPLTIKQIRSMNALRVLQPQIKAIQEKYKEDRQRMQQEMMKFYKENKVNPFASCLPLLLQLPVFLALFYLLNGDEFKEQVRATGEQGFLFIANITEPATGLTLVVLLVLFIGSQMASTMVMSVTADKTQQRIMLLLPLVFAALVPNFPAGLLVYWITTNFWTLGQAIVVRKLSPPPPSPVAGQGSRGRAAACCRPCGRRRRRRSPPLREDHHRRLPARRSAGGAEVDLGGRLARSERGAGGGRGVERGRGEVGRDEGARAQLSRASRSSTSASRCSRRRADGEGDAAGARGGDGGPGALEGGGERLRVARRARRAGARDSAAGRVVALGLRASVDVAERDGEIWAEVSGPELGLLIGKHGQTLDALQSRVRAGGVPGQRGPGARGGGRGRLPGAPGGGAAPAGGPRRGGRAALRARDRARRDGLAGAEGGPQLSEGPPRRGHAFGGRRALPPDRDHPAAAAAPRKT